MDVLYCNYPQILILHFTRRHFQHVIRGIRPKYVFSSMSIEAMFLNPWRIHKIWWRHQMETFSALLALCAGNSPVTGEFAAQRSVTRSFDGFFDLRLNKRLRKQSWGWWLERPSRAHYDVNVMQRRNTYWYVPTFRAIFVILTLEFSHVFNDTKIALW